jgi:hypothetical protein
VGDLPEEPTAPAAVPKPTPPPVVEGGAALAVPKEIERESFVETFHVREKGRRYEVAANAIANRALAQMNVAKLRGLCDRVMKSYDDNPEAVPEPKELKIIVEAFSTVDAMAEAAYSDKKAGGLANSLERLVYAATRGAAAGANDKKLPSHSPEARLKRLNSIGKKSAPTETVVELDE